MHTFLFIDCLVSEKIKFAYSKYLYFPAYKVFIFRTEQHNFLDLLLSEPSKSFFMEGL